MIAGSEHLVIGQSQMPTGEILVWVFVLIVIIVLGGLVVLALRRKLFEKDAFLGHESGLMDEMRAMHAQGELSTEEYDRIRKRLAARAAGKDPDIALTPKRSDPGTPKDAVEDKEVRSMPEVDLTGDPLPSTPDEPGTLPDNSGPKPGYDEQGFPEPPGGETSE